MQRSLPSIAAGPDLPGDTILYGRTRRRGDTHQRLTLPKQLDFSQLHLDTYFQIEYEQQVWTGCRYWMALGARPDHWQLPSLNASLAKSYSSDAKNFLNWLDIRSAKGSLFGQSREVALSMAAEEDQLLVSPWFSDADLDADPALSKDLVCIASAQQIKAVEIIAKMAPAQDEPLGEWRLLKLNDRLEGLDWWELVYFIGTRFCGNCHFEVLPG